jgi:hypothetical protein
MFIRILKDAHDGGVIDLRRRGDDFEVARAVEVAPVAEQVARADAAAAPPAPTNNTSPRIGMGPRGASRGRGRPGSAPPPELLSIGVVDETPTLAPLAPAMLSAPVMLREEDAASDAVGKATDTDGAKRGGRKRSGRKTATPAKGTAVVHAPAPRAGQSADAPSATASPRRTPPKRGTKEPAKASARGRGRAKKATSKSASE